MKFDLRQVDIRWIAVATSFLLSVFTLLLQDIPNADAFTYVRTAEIFVSDGIAAAYQHYSWATYSILIGTISWTGLDMFSAGLLLNAVFYALLVYAFISIVREIDDSKSLHSLAAICILVYPQLNEYRDLIIRDTGFWSLSILALWQYLVYARTQSIQAALIFCAALLVASAFRAEAVAYLVITPLALLFNTGMDRAVRRTMCIRLYSLAFSLAIVLLVFLALIGLNVAELFVKFTSIYEPFVSTNFTLNDEERAFLGSLLFNDYAATFSREYIELFLLAGIIAILLANMFSAIGGPYMIVLALGLIKKQIHLERRIALPVLIYLSINFIILLCFLLLTRYISSRYAMLMCILIVLFVPLTIQYFLKMEGFANKKTASIIVAIFFSYCAIDSYYSFGESKTYLQDSIDWIAENVDENAGLVTNNHAVAYFSGKVEEYDLTQRNLTEEQILLSNIGDVIAAELTFETRELLAQQAIINKIVLLAAFPDSENGRIALYQRVD